MKIMSQPISSVPVLTGKVAEEFVRKAQQAERKKGTIDTTEMMRNMRKILERSKLYHEGAGGNNVLQLKDLSQL